MYLWQIGTDGLENLFAVVRTLTHSRNVDLKELGDRLGAAVALERVYKEHQDWKRASRRLNGTLDHINTASWDTGPAGNSDVREVDLQLSWENGCVDAVAILQAHPSYGDHGARISRKTFSELGRQGVTMLKPNG